MCGIAGKFTPDSADRISFDLIQSMIGILRHRGPDESGIYIDDWIGMGHTRLSIIDLTGGAQPIHNENQSLWIIYNGEIFNYLELRNNLIKKGHLFYTQTDTEVLLHLYEDEGAEFLANLNGQFAMAIWDATKKELFLARDRVGITPLFYCRQNGCFLFGSEIKAILVDPTVHRELDVSAIDEIFTFWATLPGKTAFKNIQELPPGCYMKVSEKGIDIQRYWDLKFFPPQDQLDWSIERISHTIQEMLIDAIRLRLRADVPVGCYLSGGLDSSGVTSLTNRFDNQLKTFGIRFEESDFDESQYQHFIVDFLGTDHADLLATNEIIGRSLADVLWYCEKPLLRTAPVPLFLLSDLVHRQGYKVVLTGEGADELFGGYNIFREAKVRAFLARQPDSKYRSLLIGKLYPYIFKDPKLFAIERVFFSADLNKFHDPFFSHLIRWQNTAKIKTFLAQDVMSESGTEAHLEKLSAFIPTLFGSWDYLAKAQYWEIILFLSNYLLCSQGDRMAMAHSVEIRLPYLDHRIIEFMARVPSQYKISGLQEKYILKKSFEGVLPRQIIHRPKQPFRAPIAKSLLSNSGYPQLEKDCIKNYGIFDVDKVQRLLQKFQVNNNRGEVENMALIGILSTQLICEQFVVDFPYKQIPRTTPHLFYDRRSILTENQKKAG